jgi:hypothetical protein
MTKWKRRLRQQKADFVLKQTLEKKEIMLILNLTWAENVIIIDNNKNAYADHGWHPLNYALMKHNDLQERARTEVECAALHDAMLAFNYGPSGSCIIEYAGSIFRNNSE